MTPAELQLLIATGEGPTLEFKRSTGTLSAAFKTLCAFLNTAGGRVLIGVRNDGELLGQEVADDTLQGIARARAELEPPATVDLERVALENRREVLVLSVEPAPGLVPFTFRRVPYERIENTTQEMPQPRYHQLLLARTHDLHRWENAPASTSSLEDLDEKRIQQFIRAAQAARNLEAGTDEDLATVLDRLELRAHGVLKRAAVVLFLRELDADYPQCSLQMARFRGLDKTEFLDQAPLRYGGAFRLLEEAEVFFRRHIPVAGRIPPDSMRRIDTPAIPFDALREILINALIHRDYSVVGAGIQIAIFDDRLEVWSPGLLPEGVTIEQLLRVHTSIRRNQLISGAFFRAGMIEQWGRGTNRVAALCERAGIDPPEFAQIMGFTVVTFRAPIASTIQATVQVTVQVSPSDRSLLEAAAESPRSRRELQTAIGIQNRAHFQTAYLERLLSEGWLERTIPEKPSSPQQRYRTTPTGLAALANVPSSRVRVENLICSDQCGWTSEQEPPVDLEDGWHCPACHRRGRRVPAIFAVESTPR